MEGGGVEVSERSVKYLRLAFRNGHRDIEAYGQITLPPGAIEEGDIVDRSAVVRALTEARLRADLSFVHASLPDRKGYLFDLVIPRRGTPLSDDVGLALSKQVPLSPAEMVFDCETILAESDSSARSVVVAAFPEAFAQKYVEAFGAAGLSPLSLELESQAAARALFAGGSDAAALCVDFGVEKSVLSIVQRGVVRFATSAEGAGALDAALGARISVMQHKRQDVADIEAKLEKMKTDVGLVADDSTVEMFAAAAAALVAEINRVLVYWNSRIVKGEAREKVASMLLYGGNANIRGLTDHLSRALGLPVALADVRPALGLGMREAAIPRDQSLRYVTALGLALRAGQSSPW